MPIYGEMSTDRENKKWIGNNKFKYLQIALGSDGLEPTDDP
jgi:hypothetical protein